MSFKIHLIIVSFIILVVYLAWQMINVTPTASETPVGKSSPYSIIIVHASWGLNCRYAGQSPAPQSEGFASNEDTSNPLHEDNVLIPISDRCNNKLQCTVPITTDVLGKDPAPGCGEKEITIEYRCFTYDRPWTIKTSARTINIDCDSPDKRQ